MTVQHGHGTDNLYDPRPELNSQSFIHMAATQKTCDGQWLATCRCGWESFTTDDQRGAMAAGEQHLAITNRNEGLVDDEFTRMLAIIKQASNIALAGSKINHDVRDESRKVLEGMGISWRAGH